MRALAQICQRWEKSSGGFIFRDQNQKTDERWQKRSGLWKGDRGVGEKLLV